MKTYLRNKINSQKGVYLLWWDLVCINSDSIPHIPFITKISESSIIEENEGEK